MMIMTTKLICFLMVVMAYGFTLGEAKLTPSEKAACIGGCTAAATACSAACVGTGPFIPVCVAVCISAKFGCLAGCNSNVGTGVRGAVVTLEMGTVASQSPRESRETGDEGGTSSSSSEEGKDRVIPRKAG